MATQTTGNLKLSKPDGTDKVKEFRAPYNSNLDKIDEAVSAQSGRIDNVILKGSKHILSAGGTLNNTITLTGLTEDHVVVNWGLSVGSVSNPPADIDIVEAANAYTVVVSNVSVDFEFTPVFALPQNLT